MAIENPENQQEQTAPDRPSTRRGDAVKGSRLAINEQAAQISRASAGKSYQDGENLAITEAKGLVLGYVETSQAITEMVAEELERARAGFSEALSSCQPEAPATRDKESFLSDFRSELASLTGLTS